MKSKIIFIIVVFFLVLILMLGAFFWSKIRGDAPPRFEEVRYYVSLEGDDENDGLSAESAFATIQKAVDTAEKGAVIRIADGIYFQDFITRRDGTEEEPITITGSRQAVLKGAGTSSRVIEINHDHIILDGFTLDGLHGDENEVEGYRDKLIYAQGIEEKDGVSDLKIRNMEIKNAGGECIRLRYFARENEISDNIITNCGAYDFKFDEGGKNGEGVYIGTAPEQLDDGKNPTTDRDESNGNWVHDNLIDTRGNECVDIKESSRGNIVERNECTGQKDPESGGMDSRGNENIFRGNLIYGNVGAGVRLGGDEEKDGLKNSVYLNSIRNNEGGGIKFERMPQQEICGNNFSENGRKEFTGSKAEEAREEYGGNCALSLRFRAVWESFFLLLN